MTTALPRLVISPAPIAADRAYIADVAYRLDLDPETAAPIADFVLAEAERFSTTELSQLRVELADAEGEIDERRAVADYWRRQHAAVQDRFRAHVCDEYCQPGNHHDCPDIDSHVACECACHGHDDEA